MTDIPWDLLRQEIACAIREGIIEGMREQAKVQEHAARGIMAAILASSAVAPSSSIESDWPRKSTDLLWAATAQPREMEGV